VENKNNNSVNIRFVAKTSDIINLYENIRSDVKTSQVSTLVSTLQNEISKGEMRSAHLNDRNTRGEAP